MAEVKKYPLPEYIYAPKVMNQGRIMRGLIDALVIESRCARGLGGHRATLGLPATPRRLGLHLYTRVSAWTSRCREDRSATCRTNHHPATAACPRAARVRTCDERTLDHTAAAQAVPPFAKPRVWKMVENNSTKGTEDRDEATRAHYTSRSERSPARSGREGTHEARPPTRSNVGGGGGGDAPRIIRATADPRRGTQHSLGAPTTYSTPRCTGAHRPSPFARPPPRRPGNVPGLGTLY